ncbi:cell division protein ZapA [Candidatus Magnetominusculus xianensis]|uniref:Cell division protein ZapA n=1 Tax=Candidatus Magnetominusculus xianensis TaxID=1748249 RepID=A0ABR5SIN8_9BACT|nr:cell division protein ZapA [Candidatus Magnetominusculus xianensis]KWT91671.1 cell division protein ZapA [Candidatus Magnetominusculus xianensis]MBF0404572.1 cell division protein ZapA [Nitrospirota bacterium]
MGSAEVYIMGHKYILSGDGPDEYVMELALYLNRKCQEVFESSPNIHPLKASLIASLSITDELFKLRKQTKDLESQAQSALDSILD